MRTLIATCTLALLAASSAYAAETTPAPASAPTASPFATALASVKSSITGVPVTGDVTSIERREKKDGITYRLVLGAKPDTTEVEVDAAGKVLEYREKVSTERLPAAVRATADTAVPGATALRATRELEDGVMEYRVRAEAPGAAYRLRIAEDGKLIAKQDENAPRGGTPADKPKAEKAEKPAKAPKGEAKDQPDQNAQMAR